MDKIDGQGDTDVKMNEDQTAIIALQEAVEILKGVKNRESLVDWLNVQAKATKIIASHKGYGAYDCDGILASAIYCVVYDLDPNTMNPNSVVVVPWVAFARLSQIMVAKDALKTTVGMMCQGFSFFEDVSGEMQAERAKADDGIPKPE